MIKWIGLRAATGEIYQDLPPSSVILWGYSYNPSGTVPSGAVSRPILSSDLGYEDMVALDWVFTQSVGTLDSARTLQTQRAIHHRASNGFYIANWPAGGNLLVDISNAEVR